MPSQPQIEQQKTPNLEYSKNEEFENQIPELLEKIDTIWNTYKDMDEGTNSESKSEARELLSTMEKLLSKSEYDSLYDKMDLANKEPKDPMGISDIIIGLKDYISEYQQKNTEATEISNTDNPSTILEKLHIAASYTTEGAFTINELFEKTVDKAANAINVVVPAAAEIITTFLPAQKIVDKLIEKATHATTFVGKLFVKGTKEVFLLGLPTWIEALRINMAVESTTKEIGEIKNSSEFAVTTFIEQSELKDALKEYKKFREELADLRESDTNPEKAKELAEKIAFFEIEYQKAIDFISFKELLDSSPKEFFENNEHFAKELAENLAQEMIEKTTNHMKEKTGKLGSDVEFKGRWLTLASKEQQKESLIEELAKEFEKIITQSYNDVEMKESLKNIHEDLNKNFGLYRTMISAAASSIIRLIPIPEAPAGGYDSFWKEITRGVQEGITKTKTKWDWENAKEMLTEINPSEWYKNGADWFPSLEEWTKFWEHMANKSAGKCAEFTTNATKEQVKGIWEWLLTQSESVKEEALEYLQEQMKEGIADPLKKLAEKWNPFD